MKHFIDSFRQNTSVFSLKNLRSKYNSSTAHEKLEGDPSSRRFFYNGHFWLVHIHIVEFTIK